MSDSAHHVVSSDEPFPLIPSLFSPIFSHSFAYKPITKRTCPTQGILHPEPRIILHSPVAPSHLPDPMLCRTTSYHIIAPVAHRHTHRLIAVRIRRNHAILLNPMHLSYTLSHQSSHSWSHSLRRIVLHSSPLSLHRIMLHHMAPQHITLSHLPSHRTVAFKGFASHHTQPHHLYATIRLLQEHLAIARHILYRAKRRSRVASLQKQDIGASDCRTTDRRKEDVASEQPSRKSIVEVLHFITSSTHLLVNLPPARSGQAQIYLISPPFHTPSSDSEDSLLCSDPMCTSFQDPCHFASRFFLKSKRHHILVTLPCTRQAYDDLERFWPLSLDANKQGLDYFIPIPSPQLDMMTCKDKSDGLQVVSDGEESVA